jgi:hypothetical protein
MHESLGEIDSLGQFDFFLGASDDRAKLSGVLNT